MRMTGSPKLLVEVMVPGRHIPTCRRARAARAAEARRRTRTRQGISSSSGGVTWPACFQMFISSGGSSSGADYYGVDLTWFTGGTFTRPIFDGQNTVPTGNVPMLVRSQWVTFDNLEIARFKITEGIGECLDATYDFDDSTHTSGNDTVKNNYIHDWTITAINSSAISHGTGSICQNGAAGPINAIGNTITDKNTTAATEIGACFRNLSRVQNNDCESVAEGEDERSREYDAALKA